MAEDEALVAMMMEDCIVEAGGMVLGPVISVPDALRLLDAAMADGGVSAAVINLRLGRENTLRLADALAARRVPFIYATGYVSHHDLELHQEAPVLAKPYNAADLIQALGDLLVGQA
ncbi:response regulator [Pseudoroseomonas ludipueritiae]|uniref:Response regulator n=1 Tax=Pseudoroseomonas ludipueritiae TaxID=198093 RepID=A0ABR7R2U6_9PROT|nr:response regulator [Pseudoroseomonas ludipueritiae]MBC9176050.1 response regulator [Pseudoroseomonas ludipueritiae]